MKPAPLKIVLIGPQGSGKSRLAKIIVATLGALGFLHIKVTESDGSENHHGLTGERKPYQIHPQPAAEIDAEILITQCAAELPPDLDQRLALADALDELAHHYTGNEGDDPSDKVLRRYIEDLLEQKKKAESALNSGNAFLSEALNSGDGVYRP